jgi:hypothetical protein
MKKTRNILVLMLLLVTFQAVSQIEYYLPEGFKTYKTSGGEEVRCDNDFDNDGIKDVAIYCTNKDESEGRVVVFLSTRYNRDNIYFWFPWPTDLYYDFKFENGVLSLSNFMGFGSNATTTFFLKYYSNIENMRLIKYETEYTQGMELHTRTVNLLTREYQVDGRKGKKNLDVITLTNIDSYFDILSSIGY